MATSPGFGLKLLVAPTWQPVYPDVLETYARSFGNDDVANGVMSGLIAAAQEYVEAQTGRKFGVQQWLLTCDEFPGRQVDDYRPPTWRYGIFRLPFSPLISVDLVQYVDPSVTGGQPFPLTTLDPSQYQYDANTEPGRLAPSPYNVWPATSPLAMQAVQVTFTCGHTASNVPLAAVQAVKAVATHLYDNRKVTTEKALARLPYGLKAMVHACSTEEYD